ncbi:MAG: hypothetical protein US76_00440 [Parcubacteria group bacterium GW2011_GWA2_38_13b]|nr:MAG: hypothetical protein US76_00440 [Parcubacteria group bacterium GW2011_GWA2_38_13b]
MAKYEQNKYWHWKEIPITHRTIKEYFDNLRMDIGIIFEKKILDIGAGTRRFAKEVSELDIEAKVYSVDPIYYLSINELNKQLLKSKENIEYIKVFNIPEVKKRTVAALAEELPFKDEVFDLVISLFCLPMYINNERQVEKFFAGIARILKNSGEIRLYPVGLGAIHKKEVLLAIDIQIDELVKSGFRVIENKNDLLILRKNDGRE